MAWPDIVLISDASMLVMVYVFVAIVSYGFLEHWNFQDTLYFVFTSCTTIGYGDMVPQSDAAKLFTAFFVPLGIAPIFRSCLPYGRAAQAGMQSLVNMVIPRSWRSGPTTVGSPEERSDALSYLEALLGPLAVIGVGAGLAYRFLYYSVADSIYFASTTLTLVGCASPRALDPSGTAA